MEQEKGRHNDRRVLYTKMFLKEALFDLMQEKPVDRITTTELCKKAGINRNTFYSHYYSPRELLESLEADFGKQLVDSVVIDRFPADIPDMVLTVCRVLYAQKEFSKIIFSPNADKSFVQRAVGFCRDSVYSDWNARGIQLPEEKREMLYAFVIDGSLAILRRWCMNDMKEQPEEIADMIEKFTYGSVNASVE